MSSKRDVAVVAAKEGAEWAWHQLYEWLSPRLLGYIRARGSRDPEAALGEVWLQLARSIGSFDGDAAKFRTWAFMVAHHRVVDEARTRQRRPFASSLEQDQTLADRFQAGLDVETAALASLELDELVSLISYLPELQRATLLLRVIGDLSVAETASALGVGESAVKTAQHRAIRSLRDRLSDHATKTHSSSVTDTTWATTDT